MILAALHKPAASILDLRLVCPLTSIWTIDLAYLLRHYAVDDFSKYSYSTSIVLKRPRSRSIWKVPFSVPGIVRAIVAGSQAEAPKQTVSRTSSSCHPDLRSRGLTNTANSILHILHRCESSPLCYTVLSGHNIN